MKASLLAYNKLFYETEQNTEKVKAYKEAGAEVSKDSIAYVDEASIGQYIHREYCRAKNGIKVISKISGKKFKSTGIKEDV